MKSEYHTWVKAVDNLAKLEILHYFKVLKNQRYNSSGYLWLFQIRDYLYFIAANLQHTMRRHRMV